jgi:hypothetical protein
MNKLLAVNETLENPADLLDLTLLLGEVTMVVGGIFG